MIQTLIKPIFDMLEHAVHSRLSKWKGLIYTENANPSIAKQIAISFK